MYYSTAAVSSRSSLTAGPSSHQSATLRMRDVVTQFAVSETSIRRATESGALKCLTLPSGHRRFRSVDVLAWLNCPQIAETSIGDSDSPIPIAAVIRVSSEGQSRQVGNSDKSSLEHQEGHVSSYINNRWGTAAKVTWFKSVGSGMNFERRDFLQLIEAILRGDFRGGYIVATDFTRVCRFGIKMVEHLCKIGGCEIAYTIDDEEVKNENESLTDEILSILTHYTAKASGAKNKAINETRMDEGQLRDAYRWYKSGLSYRAIADRLSKQGRGTDAKGRLVSPNVVRRRLQDNWATLEKLYEGETPEKNSFETFAETYVRTAKNEGTKLGRKRLLAVYGEHCRANGLPILSSKRVSRVTNRLGWKKVFNGQGSVVFVGLSLNTNKGGE